MATEPVDPFLLERLGFQFGGRTNKRRAVIEVHSLNNLQTCRDSDFDDLVQDAVHSIHAALPAAIKPRSGPRRLLTFEAQQWDGAWVEFEEVDPGTVLWKEDFLARRSNSSHRCRFVRFERGEHFVFTRELSKKARAVRVHTKEANYNAAIELVAITSADCKRVTNMIHEVRLFASGMLARSWLDIRLFCYRYRACITILYTGTRFHSARVACRHSKSLFLSETGAVAF
jgi:hypothetical protein